ncbi:MAG TPA: L,D-transpeptidase family protein [Planctomycetota bacterium]|nr:L,D-transpeptidase family protein [Planctomycetota bacterium]
MKALVLLVLVVGGVAGGWWWWSNRAPAPAEVSPFAPSAPAEATPASGSATPITTPAPPPLPAVAEPPAAAREALAKADALWDAAAKAGTSPTTAKNAPEIARAYTDALTALYNQPGQAELEKRLVAERLTPLGNELFFAKTRFAEDATGLIGVHQVASGESPEVIAKKYGMSFEFLNRLRGKGPEDSSLKPGDSLKVVKVKEKGGFHLRIDKSDYLLDCFVGGVFAKRYIISHGASVSPTPLGKTRMVNRVWHPDWTHPETNEVLTYGDPRNILGPIWLPFDDVGIGQRGIGIHGYTAADSKLGAMVSHGCVRMDNDAAEELYRTLSHPDRCPASVEIVD